MNEAGDVAGVERLAGEEVRRPEVRAWSGAEVIDSDGDVVGDLNPRATGRLYIVARDGTRRLVARTTGSGRLQTMRRVTRAARGEAAGTRWEARGMSGGWLTVASAAKYLDTTPAGLRKRIERGQVPAHRFCGSIRLRAADLDKLMVPVGPVVEEVAKLAA